ncbi:MAG: hypothetical protein U5Q03_10030 [Bacteroidota bacterium]|nr:hypothetical protein [Bacteroidota bacterium]
MKKLLKPFAYILMLTIFVVVACETDKDDDPEPADPRAKFIGSWGVNETCSKGIYSVQISEDPDNSSQVHIKNFANPGFEVGDPAVGLVINDVIKLDPNQKIGDGWTVDGQGKLINDKRMEWEYELYISGGKDECTAVYAR